MSDPLDEVLNRTKASSKRPYFFKDPDVERVLNITMAVAGELAVARERIDTLERLLQERNVLGADDVEDYKPDDQVMQERMKWHKNYVARILRIVQQEIDALEADKAKR